ncbi:MAG: fibronectin type III domain-containing protein [Treponema sp.]|nr:fibronectin type III domain-containing protein [Treponema sp.]
MFGKNKLNGLMFFACVLAAAFTGCPDSGSTTRTKLPVVTTNDVIDITPTSAVMGGVIVETGNPAYTERGVCYGTAEGPTTAANKRLVYGGGLTGGFSTIVNELIPDTTYYVRAYAINDAGTAYGGETEFKTAPEEPEIPAAPAGLTATAMSASQIDLNWESATGADGYKVERSANNSNGPWTTFTLSDTATTYQDTGLSALTTYFYRVRAYNTAGDSGYSDTVSATTLEPGAGIPAAPAGLTAIAVSASQIDLGWSSVTGADGYKVERSADNSIWTEIVSSHTTTTYQDTGLSAVTTYYYRVRAYNTAGDSGYSNTASAATQTSLPGVPAAPTGLTATAVSATQINLSWNSVTGANGYRVERSTDNSNWTEIAPSHAATTYQDTGLTAGTTYWYRVRAYNAAGNSGYSNVESATTQTGLPEIPAAPAGLTATAVSASQINLGWNSVTGAQGYRVERSTDNSSWTQIAPSHTTTTYQDTGLSAGATYWYRVRAYNTAGNSGYSNVESATTQTGLPEIPVAPAGLTATAVSASQINLGWSSVTGADGYRVERSADNSNWTEIAPSHTATTYQDTGLSAGTTYWYRVRAYNAAGDSGYSTTVSAITVPAAPTGLAATVASTTQINLSWNGVTGAQGYQVERATASGGPWTTLAANNTTTTYSSTGLSAGTTYWYRVRAYNAAGDSGYSTTASAITVPAAPSGLTATVASLTSINLSWNGVTGAQGYHVERATASGGPWTTLTTNNTTTTYSSTGLTSGTTYYYRVRAYNAGGNSDYSITANATVYNLASVNTASATNIRQTTATLGGNITAIGTPGYTVKGVCWSTSQNPTTANSRATASGTGTGAYTVSATGLTAFTTYYARAYATNAAGTSYGPQVSFTTLSTRQMVLNTIYSNVDINFQLWGSGTVTVDWGDGTTPTTRTFSSNIYRLESFAYVYGGAGNRTITIIGQNVTELYLTNSSNGLSSVNFTGNPVLDFLHLVNQNNLSSLNLTQNTALRSVIIENTGITGNLNLTNNNALIEVYCVNNGLLTGLLIDNKPNLQLIVCNNNDLLSLDFFTCPQLRRVECDNNRISAGTLDNMMNALPAIVPGSSGYPGTFNCRNNPGSAGCNPILATMKGWTVNN